jgi:iron(III) transport system permease protein
MQVAEKTEQTTRARSIIEVAGQMKRPSTGLFVMTMILLTLGFFLIYPVALILIQSFNTAPDILAGNPVWGFGNWATAFQEPRALPALGNSFLIWALTLVLSMPIGVLVAWILARTRIPFSHDFEFMFWLSFMIPGITTTFAWIGLLDPFSGFINVLLRALPLVNGPIFDIYSIPGIVWVHLMGNGIALKVMLLTPAFRNMDAAMEEAARVGGASSIRTMLKVTIPVMVSPIIMVFALQLLRIFQSFETELLLGQPWGFQVYSTLIYEFVRQEDPPMYAHATVLGSATLLIVALIIPLQRWILQRRRYTTITGSFRPGLTDLGPWQPVATAFVTLLVLLLIVFPAVSLLMGTFMTRAGVFVMTPVFSLVHWQSVMTDSLFIKALGTTLIIATTAAILSPLLFSVIAYILVRTRWPGRTLLDAMIWGSGALPGMLTSLGLLLVFLGTPGLNMLFGTIWALLIVVILQGNTTGVNISKGVIVQVGNDIEEAARVSGAGWVRTYFRIWLPILMPTLVLLGTINFVLAAGATSSIILVAGWDTMTLSLLALEYAMIGEREVAAIVSLILMAVTAGIAVVMRGLGVRIGVGRSAQGGTH